MFKRNCISFDGMTLLEMMVALFISMLIMGIVITLYLSILRNHEEQKALIIITEHSRSITSYITAELRKASDLNCKKNKKSSLIKPYAIDKMKMNTAGFTLEYFDPHSVVLIEMRDKNTLLTTKEECFKLGDRLMITDCISEEIFEVKSVNQFKDYQLIETDKPLQKNYDSKSEISVFQKESFFIKQTDRKNKKGQWINALFIEKDVQSEWVEGVDDLKIEYDVLEQGVLVNRDKIIETDDIVGVSLFFKLNSLDYLSLEKTEYLYVSLQ